MRRCSSVSVFMVAGATFASLVHSASLPNGCRAGSIEFCGESDTAGPHCIECLRALWRNAGCRPQGKRGPDQHKENIGYWNNQTVLEVQNNMKTYKSLVPYAPMYKMYCYGPDPIEATDKAAGVSTVIPLTSVPSNPPSSESSADLDTVPDADWSTSGAPAARFTSQNPDWSVDGGTSRMDKSSDSSVAGEKSRVTKETNHESARTSWNSERITDESATTMVKSQSFEAETQETDSEHAHSDHPDRPTVTSRIPEAQDTNNSVTSQVVPPDKDDDWSSFDLDLEDEYDAGGSSWDGDDSSRERTLPVNGTAEIGRSRVKSDPAATRPYLILGAVLITMTLAGGGGYFVFKQVKNIGAHDITPHKGSAAPGNITSPQTSSQPTYKQFRFDEQNV